MDLSRHRGERERSRPDGSGGGTDSEFSFAYSAGDAVRAEVQISNGRVVPATVSQGWVVGWLPANTYLGTTIDIVGYDQRGRKVGVQHESYVYETPDRDRE